MSVLGLHYILYIMPYWLSFFTGCTLNYVHLTMLLLHSICCAKIHVYDASLWYYWCQIDLILNIYITTYTRHLGSVLWQMCLAQIRDYDSCLQGSHYKINTTVSIEQLVIMRQKFSEPVLKGQDTWYHAVSYRVYITKSWKLYKLQSLPDKTVVLVFQIQHGTKLSIILGQRLIYQLITQIRNQTILLYYAKVVVLTLFMQYCIKKTAHVYPMGKDQQI